MHRVFVALAISALPLLGEPAHSAPARPTDMTVEFSDVPGAGQVCELSFLGVVPPKNKVEELKTAALNLCIMRDGSQDITLGTYDAPGNSLREPAQVTYPFTHYDHVTKKIVRETTDEFLKSLKFKK